MRHFNGNSQSALPQAQEIGKSSALVFGYLSINALRAVEWLRRLLLSSIWRAKIEISANEVSWLKLSTTLYLQKVSLLNPVILTNENHAVISQLNQRPTKLKIFTYLPKALTSADFKESLVFPALSPFSLKL